MSFSDDEMTVLSCQWPVYMVNPVRRNGGTYKGTRLWTKGRLPRIKKAPHPGIQDVGPGFLSWDRLAAPRRIGELESRVALSVAFPSSGKRRPSHSNRITTSIWVVRRRCLAVCTLRSG